MSTFTGKREYKPKNVLGFFATVALGILVAATPLTAVLFLHGQSTLAICVLVVLGLLFTGLLVCAVVLVFRKPQNLMLQALSGEEFSAINRTELGDSEHGKRMRVIPSAGTADGMSPTTRALPSSEIEEGNARG